MALLLSFFSSFLSLIFSSASSFLLSEHFIAALAAILFLYSAYYFINKTLVIAFLLVIASIFTPSPVFAAFTPLSGNYYYIFFSILTLCMLRVSWHALSKYTLLLSLSILLSIIPAIYWVDSKLLLLFLYLQIAFFIALSLRREYIYRYCKLASFFCLILLVGSFIGLIYVSIGGRELFSIVNEDGRSNGFYLTTFSNSFIVNTIRPSGIYDEPGTLSFITCIVVALREELNMPRKLSFALLILGILTFSVSHLFFCVIYFTYCTTSYKNVVSYLASGSLILALCLSTPIYASLEFALFNRIQIVDGVFIADNRSSLFFNSLNLLNSPTRILFGLDSSCITNVSACLSRGYPQFGDNPLAPLVLYGFFQSLPFYSFLAFLLYIAFKRKNLLVVAVIAICMVKNEFYSFGFTLILSIYTITLSQSIRKVQSLSSIDT